MENPKLSRRIFMMTSGGSAAALATTHLGTAQAAPSSAAGAGATTLNYPRRVSARPAPCP